MFDKEGTSMSQRTIKWVLILIAALLYGMQLADYINFSVDDTFISMRVARNVADGYGFVYNIGEHVEGFSNWLWVVFMIIPLKLGFFSGESMLGLLWFAKGLSILFSILTIITLYVFIKRVFSDESSKEYYAIGGVLSLISCAIFTSWSMSGMETTSWTFFLLSSVLLLSSLINQNNDHRARTAIASSILLIAIVLSRPEGIYIAAILLSVSFFMTRKTLQNRYVSMVAISVVLVYAGFLLWRWNTYHDIFPNTYYAKTGGGLTSYFFGIKYAVAGFGSISALILVFAPLAIFLIKRYRNIIVLTASIVFALTFFMIYSSGDWMPGFRFVVPTIPLLIVLALIGIKAVITSSDRIFTYKVSIAVVIGLSVIGSMFAGRTLIRAMAPTLGSAFYMADGHLMPSHKLVAAWLHEHSDSTTLFACGEAGLIGYMNQKLRMIDLNGLMDKHIAHDRKDQKPFDVEYVLDQHPKYILLHGSQLEGRERFDLARSTDYFGMMSNSPRLHNEYQIVYKCTSFDVYGKK